MGKGTVDEQVFHVVARASAFGKCTSARVLSNKTAHSIVPYVDELLDPKHSQFKNDSNLSKAASEPSDWTPFQLTEKKGQHVIYALMQQPTWVTSEGQWGLDPSMPRNKWFWVVLWLATAVRPSIPTRKRASATACVPWQMTQECKNPLFKT